MAHVRVDKPVPKPAMQSTGDSASRGPPRSTSPSMSRRSSEWLLARGPWLLLSFSALYILLTTAVCIFVESSTAFQDVRFLSNWHMNIMVMFLGALALNLVGLITDHDHPSKWQVSVTTMFINSAAAICHLTAVLGKAPVITSSFGGRPLLPMRYIQWSFTTAAMTYLHSHIWHWDALLTIQMMMLATFMSVTGLLGTWMAFPLNVMGMAVSFYCFALLGQGLWHGYRIHLSSKDCEFSMVALRRIVLATSFLWSTYPTIWVVGGVGLISPELEEVLMGIMDVVSKGVVTHTMVQLHAVAHERHRAKSLLELEYWGSQATLERMEAILIARDRVVMSVCHELQAPVHGIIGLCESLIKMQSQGDRTSPSGRGSPRAGERGVERTPRAYGREIGEYYGTVAMLEGRDSYFRQVIRTMKSTSERLTVVLRSALDRSTSPTSPIPLKCQRIFVGDCVRHMLSLMHPLLPPNVNVTLSWDASRGNTAAEDDMYVVPVMADPSRVSQVLFTLMDLVRRFSRKGCVRVGSCVRDSFVVTSISHPGMVLTEGRLTGTEIFKPFRKGNEALAGMLGGNGFGLSLVYELVTAQGGEVSIRCEGNVTEYSFSLPICRDTGSPVAERKAVAEPEEKGVDLYLSARGLNEMEPSRHFVALTSKLSRAEEILATVLPTQVTSLLLKGPVHVRSMVPNMAVLSLSVHNFVGLATELSPLELVVFLDELFTDIDGVCENYNALKVGWGAASMVIALSNEEGSGNPGSSQDSRCAIAVQIAEALLDKCAQVKAPKKIGKILARIGLHCGPVCAAMIGFTGVQYGLYGKTVEVARVLDATAYPMTAQLSVAMYEAAQSSHGSRIVFFRMTSVFGNDNMTYVLQVGAYAEALASLDKKDETRTAERGGPQSSPKGLGMSQGAAVVARLLEDTKLKLGLDSKSDAKDIEAVLDGYRDKMLVLYDQLNAAVRRVEDLIAQKAWLEKQLEKYRGSSGTSPSEQTPSAQAAAAEGLSPCPAGAGGLNSPEAMGSAAQNHRSRVDLIVAEASDLVSELVARVSTQLPSLLSAQFSQLLHRWHQQHLRTAHHADAVNRLHQLNIPQHLMLSGEPFSRQGGGGQAYPPQPGGGGIHPGGPELMGSRWAFPPSPGLAGSIIGAGIERRYSVGSIRYAMQTSPTSQTSPLAGSPIKRNHSLPGGRQSGRAWGVLGSGGAHLSNSMPASPSGVFGRPVFPTPPMQQQQQIPMHPQQGGGGPGPQGPPQVGTPGIHPFPKLALPNKALIQQPIAENGSLKRGDGSGAGAGSHATTPAKLRPMDVRTFLGLVGMESLCDVMEREAITVEMFSYIDDADMADLGITSAATRTLIRLAARRVVAGHAMAGSPGKELANGSPGNELANGSAGNEPANGSASGNGSLSPMSPT